MWPELYKFEPMEIFFGFMENGIKDKLIFISKNMEIYAYSLAMF